MPKYTSLKSARRPQIVLHFEVVTFLDLTGDIQTRTAESIAVRHVVVVRREGVILVYSATDTELVFSVCGFKSKTVLPSDIDVVISCLSGNTKCCVMAIAIAVLLL